MSGGALELRKQRPLSTLIGFYVRAGGSRYGTNQLPVLQIVRRRHQQGVFFTQACHHLDSRSIISSQLYELEAYLVVGAHSAHPRGTRAKDKRTSGND